MISRFVRVQLALFTVISVVSMALIVVVYAQVPTLLGLGQQTITARFTDAAGLYETARVTYHGVEIGRVTRVAVDHSGVEVTMSISDDYNVPADSRAEIHSVSAIGEQYVDLVDGASDRALEDGARIPVERTSVPPTIGDVLDNANTLVETLPKDSLRTTLDELSKAFAGTGPRLQALLDDAGELVDAAQRDLEPTERLLTDAGPLLETQTISSAKIRSLVTSLSSFTDQVHASDTDLRALLDHGPPAARQVNALFQELRPTLPILLANLVNVEQVLVTYEPALETVLVVYPMITTSLISVTKPYLDQQGIGLSLRLNVHEPPPCTAGFLPPDQWREPAVLSSTTTPTGLSCKLPGNDPSVVRGARNLPCLEAPGKRAATPEECRGEGHTPEAGGNPAPPPDSPLGAITGQYDPNSGTAVTADGHFYALGGVGSRTPREEDLTWQKMLLATVGR